MVSADIKVREIRKILTQAGIADADFEARQLISFVSGLSGSDIFMGKPFPDTAESALSSLLEQRITGKPLQYLLGSWEFYGLEFKVGEGVLIPRADTEVLVETALTQLMQKNNPVILDLCAGTGCIGIALASVLKGAAVTEIELSEKAFSYLEQNIAAHGASVKAMRADVLSPDTVNRFADNSIDCIVSNPPYLNDADMASLQKEVRFEPETALYAPEDGFLFYRLLPKLWKNKLKPGGILAFEVGIHQAEKVTSFLSGEGFTDIGTADDLGSITRVVFGKKR